MHLRRWIRAQLAVAQSEVNRGYTVGGGGAREQKKSKNDVAEHLGMTPVSREQWKCDYGITWEIKSARIRLVR